jgi:2-hydroxychromene-2-carboxylate isomerase
MSAAHPIDFYFDFSCPYAYLASTRLEELVRSTGAELRLKPVLLGGIFRALEQPQNMSMTLNPAKAEHNRLDLLRWASWLEVELSPPLRHPNRTVEALRMLLATPREFALQVVTSFYRLYWVEGRDISDPAVLVNALEELGLPGGEIAENSTDEAVKAGLRQRTDEAVEAGVFGVPTFIVDGELFWGQDRMEMAAEASMGWTARQDLRANFSFNQSRNEAL